MRSPLDEEFRSAVVEKWVKLGMSEPYRLKQSGKVVVLKEPGEWVLQSTYYPPELKPAQIAIIESLGCSPPSTRVVSDTVTIRVVSSQQ